MGREAIVLCSGGIDSVVCAYYAKRLGYSKIRILFFDYGQKPAAKERECSKECAKHINAEFKCINLSELSGILDSKKEIKHGDSLKDTKNESSQWYVPYRNMIFVSYATSLAEKLFIDEKISCDILLGFKNEGKEHYPDTTKEFVSKVNELNSLSTESKTKIQAPLIDKDKEDIINLGIELGIDLKKTFSCYDSNDVHCGKCLACRLRKAGFHWAGVEDPTDYS